MTRRELDKVPAHLRDRIALHVQDERESKEYRDVVNLDQFDRDWEEFAMSEQVGRHRYLGVARVF